MLNTIITIGFLIGLIGAVMVSYGAWLMAPAAGFAVGGAFCLFLSWQISRLASTSPRAEIQQEG